MLLGPMRFAILGSGAVGGYFGARLARAGQDVTFIARGAHREAIRARGLEVRSASLGDFTIQAPAESDTTRVGAVDVVVVAVKAYDNDTAYPSILPLLGRDTVVLTLQNGVDNVDQLAAVSAHIGGEDNIIGGDTVILKADEAAAAILTGAGYRDTSSLDASTYIGSDGCAPFHRFFVSAFVYAS